MILGAKNEVCIINEQSLRCLTMTSTIITHLNTCVTSSRVVQEYLCSVVLEHCWYVLLGKLLGGETDQQTSLAQSTITNNNTLVDSCHDVDCVYCVIL